ncbi:MAG: hypothetical protein IJ852_04545 [Alphaproteobacteria bacterium]|nr:hypothetical protein [Alphaproteobacteria bacterium]
MSDIRQKMMDDGGKAACIAMATEMLQVNGMPQKFSIGEREAYAIVSEKGVVCAFSDGRAFCTKLNEDGSIGYMVRKHGETQQVTDQEAISTLKYVTEGLLGGSYDNGMALSFRLQSYIQKQEFMEMRRGLTEEQRKTQADQKADFQKTVKENRADFEEAAAKNEELARKNPDRYRAYTVKLGEGR